MQNKHKRLTNWSSSILDLIVRSGNEYLSYNVAMHNEGSDNAV